MGGRIGAQNLKSQEPSYTSDLSRPSRPIALSALWCGRTLLVLLAVLSAVLRPVIAASQNPPCPHHWRKRGVFVFAAFLFLTVGDALAQGSVATDKAALEALYDATNGPNWTTSANWKTTEPISAWHGVTTDTVTGRVTHLALFGNELSGTIPAELGDLSNLQDLDLNTNQLEGEIPEALGDLSNLEILWLHNNELTGTIPAKLGDLSNLQNLILNENQLEGEIPEALGDLSNLTSLSLRNNQLEGEIPEALGDLSNLQNLILNENQLEGEIPEALGDLSNLEILWLHNNELTGSIPAELGDLPNLLYLYLHDNQLRGSIPAKLGDLTNLQWLLLNGNQLTGTIPEALGDLPNLLYLYLHDNQLRGSIPAKLGDLTNLQWLLLNGNQLTGTIPEALGDLPNLLYLYLHDNQLRGSIPAELGDLSSLQRLRLNGNQLTGTIPAKLEDLTNLQWLLLHNNELSGSIPAELGNLTNLRYLYLHRNQLTGEIPVKLGNLTNLQYLTLWRNELSVPIPAALVVVAERGAMERFYVLTGGTNWTDDTDWLSTEPLSAWHGVTTGADGRVTRLSLPGNELSGTIPAALEWLEKLEQLNLSGNGDLTGEIPDGLRDLSNLDSLNVSGTNVCAPRDAVFQAWLETIDFQGAVCSPPRPPGGGGGGGFGGGGTPRTSVPGAVRNLTAAGGVGQVVLSWDAPSSDGGEEITDYEYRINGSGPWISTGSTETTYTVTGLDNGTAYTFEVRAVNRVGKGRVSNRNRAEAMPDVFTLDFAHFANGAGLISDLVFVNVGTHPIRPALSFYDQEGQPMAADSVVEITGDLEVTGP